MSAEIVLEHLVLANTANLADLGQRQELLHRLQSIVNGGLDGQLGLTLRPFGSYVIGLSSRSGDLDLTLDGNYRSSHVAETPVEQPLHQRCKRDKLGILRAFMKRISKSGLSSQRPQLISRARIPVLKFQDRLTGVWCDISVANLDGCFKSEMLGLLLSLDQRAIQLAHLVKLWAKQQNINDPGSGSFNSYALVLMVAFHLMSRSPPILPPLSQLVGSDTPSSAASRPLACGKTPNMTLLEAAAVRAQEFRAAGFGTNNKETIPQLLTSFLELYRGIIDFWLAESIMAGELRVDCWSGCFRQASWGAKQYFFSVEDPFDASDNAARTVTTWPMALRISGTFAMAEAALSNPRLSDPAKLVPLYGPLVRPYLSPEVFHHAASTPLPPLHKRPFPSLLADFFNIPHPPADNQTNHYQQPTPNTNPQNHHPCSTQHTEWLPPSNPYPEASNNTTTVAANANSGTGSQRTTSGELSGPMQQPVMPPETNSAANPGASVSGVTAPQTSANASDSGLDGGLDLSDVMGALNVMSDTTGECHAMAHRTSPLETSGARPGPSLTGPSGDGMKVPSSSSSFPSASSGTTPNRSHPQDALLSDGAPAFGSFPAAAGLGCPPMAVIIGRLTTTNAAATATQDGTMEIPTSGGPVVTVATDKWLGRLKQDGSMEASSSSGPVVNIASNQLTAHPLASLSDTSDGGDPEEIDDPLESLVGEASGDLPTSEGAPGGPGQLKNGVPAASTASVMGSQGEVKHVHASRYSTRGLHPGLHNWAVAQAALNEPVAQEVGWWDDRNITGATYNPPRRRGYRYRWQKGKKQGKNNNKSANPSAGSNQQPPQATQT